MKVFSRPLAQQPAFWLLIIIGVLSIARYTVAPSVVKAGTIINNNNGVASVSAASFVGSPWPIAPDTIVAAYGTRLCTTVGDSENSAVADDAGGHERKGQ